VPAVLYALILQGPCSMCDAGTTCTMFLGVCDKSRKKSHKPSTMKHVAQAPLLLSCASFFHPLLPVLCPLALQQPCSTGDAGTTPTMVLDLCHKRSQWLMSPGAWCELPKHLHSPNLHLLYPPPFLPVQGDSHLKPPWLQAVLHVAPTLALHSVHA
jgi:hypothetical protein